MRLVPLTQERRSTGVGVILVGTIALVPSLVWTGFGSARIVGVAVLFAGIAYLSERVFGRRRRQRKLENARPAPPGAEVGTWRDSLRRRLPALALVGAVVVVWPIATRSSPAILVAIFVGGAVGELLEARHLTALEQERGTRFLVEPKFFGAADALYTKPR